MPKKKPTQIYSVTLFAQGSTAELLSAIDHIRDALVHGDHTRDQRLIQVNNMAYIFREEPEKDTDPEALRLERYI